MSTRRRVAAVVAAAFALTICAVPAAVEAQDAKKKLPKIGCELLEKKAAKNSACVKTDVEAWYHSESSGIGLPPVTGLPEFNPYEEDTLHVGIKQGSEDSRIYLTLDVANDLPVGATITGGKLVLPLDEDGSEIPDEFSLQSCTVQEPPEKSAQGSFDPPPKAACSIGEPARIVEKPQPMLVIDVTPLATALTIGEGIALVPGEDAVDNQETWHFSVFGRKNESKEAVDIGAILGYEEFETLTDLAPPTGEPFDEGGAGGGGAGVGAPPDFSTGGFDTAPTGQFDTGGTAVGAPVQAQPPQQAQPLAAVAVPRYKGVWFLPLVGLAMVGMLGIALTRDLRAARI